MTRLLGPLLWHAWLRCCFSSPSVRSRRAAPTRRAHHLLSLLVRSRPWEPVQDPARRLRRPAALPFRPAPPLLSLLVLGRPLHLLRPRAAPRLSSPSSLTIGPQQPLSSEVPTPPQLRFVRTLLLARGSLPPLSSIVRRFAPPCPPTDHIPPSLLLASSLTRAHPSQVTAVHGGAAVPLSAAASDSNCPPPVRPPFPFLPPFLPSSLLLSRLAQPRVLSPTCAPFPGDGRCCHVPPGCFSREQPSSAGPSPSPVSSSLPP
jgi:hypothetical protein